MSTLQTAFFRQQLTPITYKSSGGTYTWTPTSLANGAGRSGPKADLAIAATGKYPRVWSAQFEVALAVAVASDYLSVELWWSGSDNATAGTHNPGGHSGTDATLTSASTLRYGMTFLGFISLTITAGTGVQISQPFEFYPLFRYGSPLLYNASGQALHATATNHVLTLTPLGDTGEDALT